MTGLSSVHWCRPPALIDADPLIARNTRIAVGTPITGRPYRDREVVAQLPNDQRTHTQPACTEGIQIPSKTHLQVNRPTDETVENRNQINNLARSG